MKRTLLVLAAGLGTRYGGLKQIDPVGPNAETIIDYSIYDAMRAGFDKLVFVIRHYFEDAFQVKIGSKFEAVVETAYAYQELDTCLEGFQPPHDRQKPWGTGHAILLAQDLISGPFAVINADDYYGPDSFRILARFLATHDPCPGEYAMVGYTLRDTLSEYGPVSRGVCRCDGQMLLRQIDERKSVQKTPAGIRYLDDDGTEHFLTGSEIVSMNLWGFQTSVFAHLQSCFRRFLSELGAKKGSELFIPEVVDELIKQEKARVRVLPTSDVWFGVTFRRDAFVARECIRRLIDRGLYPEKLWE
jgi:UTP-glucose-1-phosphate uridylyltransferase